MTLVLIESDGPVRTLRLNAPERRNALDLELLDELAAAVETVKADSDARALVVTGEGRAFCAGADLTSLFGDTTRPVHVLRDHLMKNVYASFLGLRELTIPTIAAVQGVAVGAGLNIALACDVIVAGPDAGFGPTFASIGLNPGGGCSWMLTQRIGAGNAMAAMLSGDVIGAADAYRMGLANFLVDEPVTKASGLAALYGSRSSELNAAIKRSVQVAAASDFDTSLDLESWAQASTMRGEVFAQYLADFRARH